MKRSKTLETTHLSPDAGGDGPLARFWQAGAPFVLLDDARPDGRSLLYRSPEAVLEARSPQEVRACLARLRAETRHAAGWLAYEAGHALEPKLAPLARTVAPGEPPLLWLGLFGEPEAVDVDTLLPDGAGAWASAPRPRIEREAYLAAVARVREHILDGDVYQANLTFRADVSTGGHPLSLYAALRPRARAGWGGIVFTGAQWILSFSPELFFTLESGHVTARPMKGTAPTGIDPDRLRNDPKQQAENLMIVDLIRNDLSRVSRPGTVQVPELFAVETYPTVLQMTSTVTAGIEDGLGPVDLIEAAFPCGSVTGAPKIRAMELIAELEPDSRGLYTGSIGRVAPGGEAAFNVAIRTLVLEAGESGAVLGLGSGIVADSIPEEEWRECLAKGAFVQTGRRFDLIETMRFDPEEGVAEIERHLARMKGSAEALGFAFDRHDARNELQAATFYLKAPRRLRLLLSRSGALAIESRPLGKPPAEPVRVRIAPLPVEPEDFRLRHKTSDRAFYDEARAAAGVFELLFEDSEGFLTEGSFTSLFVEKEGRLVTPPLTRGLLPGVLRQRLIDQGRALEGELRRDDLGAGFYIGNALRGLIPARLAED